MLLLQLALLVMQLVLRNDFSSTYVWVWNAAMAASQVCNIASWVVHFAFARNLYPGIPRHWTKLVCPTGILRLYGPALVFTAIAAFSALLVPSSVGFSDAPLIVFLGLAGWLPGQSPCRTWLQQCYCSASSSMLPLRLNLPVLRQMCLLLFARAKSANSGITGC